MAGPVSGHPAERFRARGANRTLGADVALGALGAGVALGALGAGIALGALGAGVALGALGPTAHQHPTLGIPQHRQGLAVFGRYLQNKISHSRPPARVSIPELFR